MASDWVKSRDTEFREQVTHLVCVVAAYLDVWGLVGEDLTSLRESQAAFEAAMVAQAHQAAVYHAVVARKQAQRQHLERELRTLVRRINNHPGMTDTLRQQMHLASPVYSRAQAAPLDTARQTGPRCPAQSGSEGSSVGNPGETQP